jgi:P2 family phage major capsid protein
MRNTTRLAFNSYVSQIALLSSVPSAAEKFTVAPSVAQKLEEKTQASSEFLSKINFVTVTEQEGEKVGVGITSTIAGRTDTSKGERQPIDPTGLTATRYRCEQTNFDTAISYAKLDAWAHKPEFQTIVRDAITKRQGLDRMIIGWHGTHVAKQTDRTKYPLLQDVNKGWIQHTREDAPARILSDGKHSGDADDAGHVPAIHVSAKGTADYVNLDALVFDALQLLDEQHRRRTDLVVFVSDELVHDKKFALVNAAGDTATEQLARDVLLLQDKIGGKLAAVVPNFPAGTVVITTYDNLSIYNQAGTRRRAVIDNPKRDQVENFESVNEDYVVEDYGLIAIYENIVMEEAAAAEADAEAGA